MPTGIPFTHAGGDSGAGHLLKVPVVVNGHATTFILDTGIGITLIDAGLAERWGLTVDGGHAGKRMSGQELEVPLTTAPWLEVAGVRHDAVRVGVWDMGPFLPDTPEFAGVEGFVGLDVFRQTPFTLDYGRGRLVVEDAASLADRVAAGATVPLEVRRDGPCITTFFDLQLPGNAAPARVELDLGGGRLTLHARYAPSLGVDLDADDVEVVARRDETGFDYTRWFTRFAGPIAPSAAPACAQHDVPVMFQEIIYDGLIGDGFVRRFVVTFDLPNDRMILGPR